MPSPKLITWWYANANHKAHRASFFSDSCSNTYYLDGKVKSTLSTNPALYFKDYETDSAMDFEVEVSVELGILVAAAPQVKDGRLYGVLKSFRLLTTGRIAASVALGYTGKPLTPVSKHLVEMPNFLGGIPTREVIPLTYSEVVPGVVVRPTRFERPWVI